MKIEFNGDALFLKEVPPMPEPYNKAYDDLYQATCKSLLDQGRLTSGAAGDIADACRKAYYAIQSLQVMVGASGPKIVLELQS